MDTHSLEIEEERLRGEIAKLPNDLKKQYYNIEKSNIKDPDTYAVLNWFFVAGLHHFYLGNNSRGLFNAVVMLVGLLTIQFFYVGIILIIGIMLFEVPQLFYCQKIVHEYNVNVMKDALVEVGH